MGDWRSDQSKTVRRVIWGQSRGEMDPLTREFIRRIKPFAPFAPLRLEKLGEEIHFWRMIHSSTGEKYWASCMRFVDDGWGYWTVFFRDDERRWRKTSIRGLPIGKAIAKSAEILQEHEDLFKL